MRVLFTAAATPTHFHIQVPLAHAFREAGHAVAFATGPNVLPRLARLGFSAFPVGPAYAPRRGQPPTDPRLRLWRGGGSRPTSARPPPRGSRTCSPSRRRGNRM